MYPRPREQARRALILRFTLTYVLCLTAVSAAVALVWESFERPQLGVDDAYIFFVYARNLADGYGFVYNVGGEAVEGFTSLLWTLICALAFRITSTPHQFLLALNIALVALSASIVVLTVRALAATHRWRTWIGAAFGVSLLSEFGYVTWNTITLMDNALWSTLLTLLTALTCVGDARSRRRSAGVALLTGLLVLTRPEALVWAPLFIAILTFRAAQASTVRAALPVAVLPAVVFVLTLGAVTAFRLAYFGYPLPNTFYAKMSPALGFTLGEGMRYLASYVVSGLLPFLASVSVGFGLVHVATRDRRLRMVGAPLVLAAAAGLAIPVLAGGDHFGAFRFYQYVLPVLVLGLASTTLRELPRFLTVPARLAESRMRIGPALAVIGLVLVTVRAVNLRDRAREAQLRKEFHIAQRERSIGVSLERLFAGLPALPSVGVIAAGGIKYEYDGDVIDLMGLNNLHVAHNAGRRIGLKNHAAFEKQSLYDLQPDIVAPLLVDPLSWRYSPGTIRDSFNNEVLRGIFDDAAFTALYRFCLVTERAAGPRPGLTAWVHHRRLRELRAQPHVEVREFPYSSRSAVIGSTRAARRAGIAAASAATATMPVAARPSVHGSAGSMP
jgi:arabinofuranosyltransferase